MHDQTSTSRPENSEDETSTGIFAEREANFEKDILDVISPMGKFQWRVRAWASAVDASASICIMFSLFAGINPGFTCSDVIENRNVSDIHDLYKSDCYENGTQCKRRRFYDGDYVTIISEWDLVCEKKIYATYISSAFMVGMLVGASLFGRLADVYGRKRVIFPVLAGMMLSHGLTASAQNWQAMLFFRLTSGFFAGGALCINDLIPMELTSTKWRGVMVGLSGFPLGILLVCLQAYLIHSWHHLAIANAIIALPTLICWWIIPESPRWLLQMGRFKDAQEVISWVARVNGRPEPDYTLLPRITKLHQSDVIRMKTYTLLDLFRTKQLTINTCALSLLWFTVSATYYGISMNVKELSGDYYINIVILSGIEILFNFSAIITTHCFSRRQCAIGYMSIGAICLLLMLGTSLTLPTPATTYMRIATGVIGRAAINGGWCVATLMSVELFPALMRNTALGFHSTSARVGGTVAPFLSYLYFIHPSIPYAVFAGLAIITVVSIFFFIAETKGKPMQDHLPDKTRHLCGCCSRPRRHTDNDEKSSECLEERHSEVAV